MANCCPHIMGTKRGNINLLKKLRREKRASRECDELKHNDRSK